MGDEKADLVHVSGNHDSGAVAPFGADDVPQDINPQVIDEGAQGVDNNRPNPVLATGNPWCFADLLQQFEVHGIRHVVSIPPAAQAVDPGLTLSIGDAL
jgi:hypothetical protein